MIETPRLRLRPWRSSDKPALAALNADPEVSADLSGPLSRAASDAKLERYAAAFQQHGFTRWVIESRTADFLGYAGVMPGWSGHPLGDHYEIGWRLVRPAWGQGIASEAARAALADAFQRTNLLEILAYTAPNNLRSQAVMARLHLKRDPSRDFTALSDDGVSWDGLVWFATP